MHIKGKTVGKLTCNVNHLVRTISILWVKEGAYPYYKEAINARHIEGSSTRGGINKSKGGDGTNKIKRIIWPMVPMQIEM